MMSFDLILAANDGPGGQVELLVTNLAMDGLVQVRSHERATGE